MQVHVDQRRQRTGFQIHCGNISTDKQVGFFKKEVRRGQQDFFLNGS